MISQIIGYAISKYGGIKFCSEIPAKNRAITRIWLVLFAELALIVYGIGPNDYKVLVIFFNALLLGIVWYLEGRRTSEVLLAGLSCSFIISSGVVKDFGCAVMSGVIAGWWAKIPLIGGSQLNG